MSVSLDDVFVDILEQIFVRLDVEDLMRCKSVCKSWQSLISDNGFIKSHLNYSYKKDRKHVDYQYFHRRIVMSKFDKYNPNYKCYYHEYDYYSFDCYKCNLIGSSNGLVCISPSLSQVLVVNPLTRQFILLQDLNIPYYFLKPKTYTDNLLRPLCSGFGYDSSTDDYKVIFGFTKCIDKNLHVTCFQVLTLKSNAWKDIGQVKYTCISNIGTFYNGAIHWVMMDQTIQSPDKNKVILSFCLSKEEFKEIPPPDDVKFQFRHDVRIGVFDECLCIFRIFSPCSFRWVMKNYNTVKQSWEPLPFDEFNYNEYDSVHYLVELWYLTRDKTITSFTLDSFKLWSSVRCDYIGAPIFVRSLVSPHRYFNNGRLKRKMPFK